MKFAPAQRVVHLPDLRRRGLNNHMASLNRIHVPLLRPEDVIPHLGKGELHWRDGYSAKAVCESWFDANDIPLSVRQVLDSADEYQGSELIDAWLERCTHLPWGRGNPTQTDLLAVLAVGKKLAVLAIEAKVRESFGPYVRDWLAEGGNNRAERLHGLCDLLNLSTEPASALRYQLLHRTAAAVLEARRYRAGHAAMVVQSFCPDCTGLSDFQIFAQAMGYGHVDVDSISPPKRLGSVELRIGWSADRLRSTHI